MRNGPNRFQVFLEGGSIVYFLNGREIARAKAVWPTGMAGVISGSSAQAKTKVAFDDWKVWTGKDGAAPSAGAAQR